MALSEQAHVFYAFIWKCISDWSNVRSTSPECEHLVRAIDKQLKVIWGTWAGKFVKFIVLTYIVAEGVQMGL